MHLLKVVAILLQGVVFVRCAKIRWTLAKSCYENPKWRDAIIQAVATSKERASDSITALRVAKIPLAGTKLKETASFLLGSKNFFARSNKAIDKFKIYSLLEGPLGLADSKFADSPEWLALKKDPNHWKDCVIYCRPDLNVEMVDRNLRITDRARGDNILSIRNALYLMMKEEAAGKFEDPDKIIGAVTNDHKGDPPNPGSTLAGIPETITIHPLWLKHLEGREFGLLTDLRIRAAAQMVASKDPQTPENPKDKKKALTSVDSLMGLDGTMQHEFLHLTAFGKLVDADKDAYGWINNVKTQSMENPDLLALLGLALYLVDKKGGTIDVGGYLTLEGSQE